MVTMKSLNKSLLVSLVASVLALPLTAQAAIKCWTNKDGVRECGNAVPPEYAQQESRTIDKRGMTTGVTERALNQQERKALRRQEEAEKKRLEEEERQKAMEEQRRKEQAIRDRVLLATFLTEEEIVRSRERKLVAIDANLEITRITIDKLQQKLDQERAHAAKLKNKGKALPERTQEDIDNLEQQLSNKKNYADSKEKERQALIDKYEADIIRFRELKGTNRQQQ